MEQLMEREQADKAAKVARTEQNAAASATGGAAGNGGCASIPRIESC